MYKTCTLKWKPLLLFLLLSLGVGGLAGFLIQGDTAIYDMLRLPPLAPPKLVFPIVWTLLYLLMGVSAYFVFLSNCRQRNNALYLYALQLIVNFFWPILFFKMEAFAFAFVWIVILCLLVALLLLFYFKCSLRAALLQLPYFLWLLFAAYLNYGVMVLN